eukprot:Phypoly_transcript_17565.p1 GENE.Phypoly_transcript_17565~~Phypoly_transcript_17565.p1  ORF type:complete len:205 (+),score=17.47 Phypoly_transcript_17565:162-776(+)
MFSFRFLSRCTAQSSKSSSFFMRTRPSTTKFRFSTLHSTKGNNSWRNSGAVPLLLAIPAAAVGAAMCERKPVVVESPLVVEPQVVTPIPSGDIVITETPSQIQVQDRLGRISFGFLTGFVAGYAAKKIGKFVLIAVGTFFLLVQYLSYRGYMSVNWANVVDRASPITDPTARRRFIHTIITILTHNLLMKTGFVTGMGLGFKLG